jgi:hypothetical protein
MCGYAGEIYGVALNRSSNICQGRASIALVRLKSIVLFITSTNKSPHIGQQPTVVAPVIGTL